MKFWSRLLLRGRRISNSLDELFIGRPAAAQAQMPTPPPGVKAGQFFKNVTTSTLKDLSVDDFLGAMGVITGDLGFDCADCHPGAGGDKADFVTDASRDEEDGTQDDRDGGHYQQDQLFGRADGHVLHVPSRPRHSRDFHSSGQGVLRSTTGR